MNNVVKPLESDCFVLIKALSNFSFSQKYRKASVRSMIVAESLSLFDGSDVKNDIKPFR